jgi:predicted metal-binding membrane protein
MSTPPLAPARAIPTVVLIVGIAGAWAATIAWSQRMSGMVDGLAGVGMAMPLDVTVAAFVGMWLLMMAAMMLPGEAPTVLGQRSARFVAGYLGAWLPAGVVALAAVRAIEEASPSPAWAGRIAAVVFVVAGAYQLSPTKATALAMCRRDAGPTIGAGFGRGLWCLRSSGALMAILIAVGVMNLPWSAMIGAAVAAEKNQRANRAWLAVAVGITLIVAGVAIAVHPAELGDIAMRHM